MFDRNVLEIDLAVETEEICDRLREVVAKTLLRRGLVVGLSGGIDSSVTCALAVRAFGQRRVFGLLMPERDSSGTSVQLGRLLADELGIDYEIEDIARFPRVDNFISYARLVKCPHESAGKRTTGKHSKIGNVHLKWAFSEAACLFLRGNERGQAYHRRLVSRYGKAKALSIIAQKLGRVVYTILKRRTAFDAKRFYESVS